MTTAMALSLLLAGSALLGLSGCTREVDAAPAERPAPSAKPLPRIRVRVAVAERGQLAEVPRLTGKLHAFSEVVVAAEAPGRVTARKVERGARVSAGTLLYEIDRTAAGLRYQQAQASAGAAEAEAEHATRQRARGDALVAGEVISVEQHDRLSFAEQAAVQRQALARAQRKSAAQALRDARTVAPITGIVAALHAEVGDWVAPGKPLATVIDVSRLRLRVGLTGAEAAGVESGARVPVHFADLGGAVVEAELHDISPLADRRTGTYSAELWLEPGDQLALRPGMVGRLELPVAQAAEALLVPRGAVERVAGGFGVWVVERAGQREIARRRSVSVGRHDREHVQILTGLEQGERVVITGMFALAAGDEVRVDRLEGEQAPAGRR